LGVIFNPWGQIRVTSQDASTLMREAHALKAAGRLDEAALRYGEALAAKPSSGVAEHNLAACLGEAGRWDEAEPHIRKAFTKGVDAPETWLLLARCDQWRGRLDPADAAFREALRRRPDMFDAQRELAQLLWMRTGDAAAATAEVDRFLSTSPRHVPLLLVRAEVLASAGRADEAFALISPLATEMPNQPSLLVHAAQLATGLKLEAQALTLSDAAYRLSPTDLPVLIARSEALLAAGQAEPASHLAADMRRKWSTNQHAIALQATAWRMLGDQRYRRLCDYETMIGTAMLDTPTGWSSLEDYLADLAPALNDLHGFVEPPLSASLRHGSYAPDILHRQHPALKALRQALDGPILRRLADMGSGDDPVRSRNRGAYTLQDMWSVQLKPKGHHADHVRPHGWLSGVCHIESTPSRGREGWLRFGQPGLPAHPPLQAEHHVEPKPGMLVLFPSYMWQGASPGGGKKRELTIAFDIVPGPARFTNED
jgi:predicted Zn-dependent protease